MQHGNLTALTLRREAALVSRARLSRTAADRPVSEQVPGPRLFED